MTAFFCLLASSRSAPERRLNAEVVLSESAAEVIWGGVSSPPSPASEEAEPSPLSGSDRSSSDEWSDALQSVLEHPPASLPRNLILGGFIFTAVLGAWAWLGTVEEVSFAQGRVAPQGDVYRVQPSVAGEIIHIYVREGDEVQKGQKIAEIDHELVEKEIERLEENLNAYQLQLGQRTTLIQQNQSELDILQTVAQANVVARQSSVKQEQATITTFKQLLAQYQLDRQAQASRLRRLEELVKQGALADDHLFQLEQTLRERDRSITETQGSINHSAAAIAQLQAELVQTQATAEQQLLTTQEKLQQLQIEAAELTAKITETHILLSKTQKELSQAVLVAPVGGVLSSLKVANAGEVLQPGDTLAEIAPASAPMVLSATLPSQEAGLVEPGMPVNLKFDAFPYQDYGIVKGKVLSISADADINKTTGATYQVEVALAQKTMQHEGREVPLKAGQTATAEIITSRKRIISVLLDPIRKLKKSNISL